MILIQNIKAQNQAEDFPTLAQVLITEETGDKQVFALTMAKRILDPVKELKQKNIVYVIAHGDSDGIVNYSSGNELGAKLSGGLGISKKNTSCIVLIACNTGAHSVLRNKNFAQQLTQFMKIDVYAPSYTITMKFNMKIVNGIETAVPLDFMENGRKVGVIGGKGLNKFTPDGGGYIPATN